MNVSSKFTWVDQSSEHAHALPAWSRSLSRNMTRARDFICDSLTFMTFTRVKIGLCMHIAHMHKCISEISALIFCYGNCHLTQGLSSNFFSEEDCLKGPWEHKVDTELDMIVSM